MTSKERKDKCANAMGRKEVGLATTLMHLKETRKPIVQFQSRIECQAMRSSHITTELVNQERHRSKRDNINNRYNNNII
jgi:hypothetical protein